MENPIALYKSLEDNKQRRGQELASGLNAANRAFLMMAQRSMQEELAGKRGEAARLAAKADIEKKRMQLAEDQRAQGADLDHKTFELYVDMLKNDPESAKLFNSMFPNSRFAKAGIQGFTPEQIDSSVFNRADRAKKESRAKADTDAYAAGAKIKSEGEAKRNLKYSAYYDGGREDVVSSVSPLMEKAAMKMNIPYIVKGGKKVLKTDKRRGLDRDYMYKARKKTLKKITEHLSKYTDLKEQFPDDPAFKKGYWEQDFEEIELSPIGETSVEIFLEAYNTASTGVENKIKTPRDDRELTQGQKDRGKESLEKLKALNARKLKRTPAAKDSGKGGVTSLDTWETLDNNIKQMQQRYSEAKTNRWRTGSLEGFQDQATRLRVMAEGLLELVEDPTEKAKWETLVAMAKNTENDYYRSADQKNPLRSPDQKKPLAPETIPQD